MIKYYLSASLGLRFLQAGHQDLYKIINEGLDLSSIALSYSVHRTFSLKPFESAVKPNVKMKHKAKAKTTKIFIILKIFDKTFQ